MPDEIIEHTEASAAKIIEQQLSGLTGLEDVLGKDPTPAQEEAPKEETPKEEPTDVPVEDTEEDSPKQEDAEPAEDSVEQKTDADEHPEEEETAQIETLAELAEALNLTQEELSGTLKHTFKAAGTEHTVSLAEMQKGYQLQADYTKGKEALAQAKAEADRKSQEELVRYQNAHKQLADQYGLATQLLQEQLNNPEMETLKSTDPGAYWVHKAELKEKLETVAALRAQSKNQYQQQLQKQQVAFIEAEAAKVRQALPDWSNDHAQTVVDMARELGFNDDDLSAMHDSRIILGLQKLGSLEKENAALRKQVETGTKITKKIKRTVPKLQKPNPSQAKKTVDVKTANLNKLTARLKKSGRPEDAIALIEYQLNQG